MATIKKTKRSPLRTPLIKYEPTVRLEPPPTVADFVSAPSGHLRSLSPPSLAAFPGNCSKPSQFPGAHFASWFKILCPLNKKTAQILMHGTILSRLSDLNQPLQSQTSCLLLPGVFVRCRRPPWRLFLEIAPSLRNFLALTPLVGSKIYIR